MRVSTKECISEAYDTHNQPASGPHSCASGGERLRSLRASARYTDHPGVESGVTARAVLQGDILFLSLVCTVAPKAAITPEIMASMLAADNGISTSYFQLYDVGGGKLAVTPEQLLQAAGLGPEDEDEVLSCVHFLLVDVMTARGA